MIAKAGGVGGVFFKTCAPRALSEWYGRNLGIPAADDGLLIFDRSRAPA